MNTSGQPRPRLPSGLAAWCVNHGLQPLPASPKTVALYLTALAQQRRRTSTIQRRVAAISQAHQAAGLDSPTKHAAVRTVLAGIRRTLGTAQDAVAPAVVSEIRAMVDTLPDTLAGHRDRALLLLGFAGASRRSELVALDVADIAFTLDGLVFRRHR